MPVPAVRVLPTLTVPVMAGAVVMLAGNLVNVRAEQARAPLAVTPRG